MGRRRGTGSPPRPTGRRSPGPHDWTVERRIGGTPIDIGGAKPRHLVTVEFEWRRADPADNTAKLFRHLAEGTVAADSLDAFRYCTVDPDVVPSRGETAVREDGMPALAETAGRIVDAV